jgi:hypothetical protein
MKQQTGAHTSLWRQEVWMRRTKEVLAFYVASSSEWLLHCTLKNLIVVCLMTQSF